MPPSNVLRSSANSSPREIELPRGRTVHIWRGSLDVSESECTRLAAFLDARELQRARRFRFPLHRSRFIAGRGLLRSILSQYLRSEPGTIGFEYSVYGKPHLKHHDLQFNLAHSENIFVLAVSESPIGVDLELRRPIPDLDSLADQVFSPLELELWQTTQTLEAFLRLWTRKEALLKAIGLGIATHVKDVSVFFENDSPLKVPQTLTPERWTVRTFSNDEDIWSIALPFGPAMAEFYLSP
jgi:4'-phosphopantetheinyl transferase